MKIAILSGVPGCGKSTWAEKNGKSAEIFSADYYFMQDGVYRFDPLKLQDAHNWCFHGFLVFAQSPRRGCDKIIIDNTNTQAWEMAPYVRVAECFGWDIQIIRFAGIPHFAAARNIHGVPIDKVLQMYNAMGALPPHWMKYVTYVPF